MKRAACARAARQITASAARTEGIPAIIMRGVWADLDRLKVGDEARVQATITRELIASTAALMSTTIRCTWISRQRNAMGSRGR